MVLLKHDRVYIYGGLIDYVKACKYKSLKSYAIIIPPKSGYFA